MIKRAAIVLLCLSVSSLTVLNILLHMHLKQLSQGTKQGTTVSKAVETSQKISTGNAAGQNEEPAYNIEDLKSRLAAIEQELDDAMVRLSDKVSKDTKNKKADEDKARQASRSFAASEYASFFKDLGLSPENQERFKDIYADRISALDKIGDVPDKAQRISDIKKEYDERFRELLGDAGFERYTTFNKRSDARGFTGRFLESLGPDEALTGQQEDDFLDRVYGVLDRYRSEKIQDQSGSTVPVSDEENGKRHIKAMEDLYSRLIEGTRETLSPYQLEQFKDYLKKDLDASELSLRINQ
jgi:hypothetical protein